MKEDAISEQLTRMKLHPASSANFSAKNVLPQPGGPYKRAPLGSVMFNALARSGSRITSMISERNFSFSSVIPAKAAKPFGREDGLSKIVVGALFGSAFFPFAGPITVILRSSSNGNEDLRAGTFSGSGCSEGFFN